MKAAGRGRAAGSARKRQTKPRRRASQRLERLDAGYHDLRSRVARLQRTLDAALAGGEITLATVDPDNLDGVRRFEDSRLQEAGRRLKAEMKSLRAAGVIDAKGEEFEEMFLQTCGRVPTATCDAGRGRPFRQLKAEARNR